MIWWSTPSGSRVHPRACGGNRPRNRHRRRHRGPSPRVRGKLVLEDRRADPHRSIPARAGETRPHPADRVHPRVHPRACGGNWSSIASSWLRMGPSPRVRGKPHAECAVVYQLGSIPARAGETFAAASLTASHRVHPRACGGNRVFHMPCVGGSGPSPRVRGKRTTVVRLRASRRSIPARAGETTSQSASLLGLRVHPRACGGNSKQKAKI